MNRNLIEKFIQGKCSPEEELKVIDWMRSKDYDAELGKIISEDLKGTYEFGLSEYRDLSHIRKDILKKHGSGISHNYRGTSMPGKLLRVAASIVILTTVGLSIFLLNNKPSKVSDNQHAVSQITKSNPRGRKSTIFLADGTKVNLNSESKISYPDSFSDSARIIHLEGEAFFEVVKDPKRPFTVHTNYLDLKVLGTSFNVKTFSNSDKVKIALATGKVEVTDIGIRSDTTESVMLTPGQSVIFNKTERTFGEISDFDPNYEYGWKNGVIYFDKASLQEVIEKLERWYDVKINVVNKPSHEWVYNAYHENESLELVLQSMAHNEAFDFDIDENQITIKFK